LLQSIIKSQIWHACGLLCGVAMNMCDFVAETSRLHGLVGRMDSVCVGLHSTLE